MAHTQDGGPAFPRLEELKSSADSTPDYPEFVTCGSSGMSLRDYFAGQVIREGWYFLAPDATEPHTPEDIARATAKTAYLVADAMLKARDGE